MGKSMAEFLSDADRALDNGLNDSEIASRLANFGYTAAKLQEGRALYEEARQLYQDQQRAYGDQYAATDDFETKWAAAREIYGRHIKLARIALEGDRDALQSLGLIGKRPSAFGPWQQAALLFYETPLADEALRQRMAEVGLTEEALQEGLTKVQEVKAAEHVQEQRRGTAQELTKQRDAAFQALRAWMDDYLTVAKVALKDQPQLAEKLGILVRS